MGAEAGAMAVTVVDGLAAGVAVVWVWVVWVWGVRRCRVSGWWCRPSTAVDAVTQRTASAAAEGAR